MKDYQKSLDSLENDYKSSGWHNLSPNQFKIFKENLQELVDKAIPMKPTYPKEYPVPTCPVCGGNIGDNKYCRECGQAIDNA